MKRSDALINREALLRAAFDVFAERGFDVPLEDIAAAANVSRTTLYRNFKDKQALGIAIFESNLVELEAIAAELRDKPDGLTTLLKMLAEGCARSAGLADVLCGNPSWEPQLQAMRDRVTKLMQPLLVAAKRHKQVRSDLSADDLDLMLDLFGTSNRGTQAERMDHAQRVLDLLYKGIRP
ncbi:TetR/AcrR family transcriptional regulator [Oxalicibacterium faecigallinarum]|uniref:HTH tetR-type domain-containing protein n=1 Tax=Oxalicibacterium faecigallinarum TaxID=573741 RepID=A0A8J3F0Q5_9BURK|nr:TetR/AcrR family transcriptional regulator [Oxalicibacterium faecigallinarum]GGI18170.1 hypothetical protein GCM10008066_12660 [Oxalicibacterium faecigallinarum]